MDLRLAPAYKLNGKFFTRLRPRRTVDWWLMEVSLDEREM